MSALGEELELLAFEAPYMGIPAGFVVSARALTPEGRFVEMFIDIKDSRVVQAGFLTDIPVEGVLCASIWCGFASGASLGAARSISPRDILAEFPPGYPPPTAIAKVCIRAAVTAITRFTDENG